MEQENKGLEPGEKYLTISLLGGALELKAWPNKEPKSDNSPQFVANGVAVWVNEKKESSPTPSQSL